jgi:hypothetical protein
MMLSRFFVMAGRMFMVLRRFCIMFCALLAHKAFEGVRSNQVRVQTYSSSIRLWILFGGHAQVTVSGDFVPVVT